ncbi:MAG: T9SS type A sorting domain-containing protein [Flavobacterium sp.]|nr:T9SS type A sorting domain-containing protein [Flavobacterium sp.]
MRTKLFLFFTLFTLQSNAQCWSKISSGAYHTIAIANNGTLWAWGYNNSGQVGNGTTVNQNIPVQIGTDTDWVYVGAGYYHSFAIKSNGTLWGWGDNSDYKIKNNTPSPSTPLTFTEPIQIGNDTNWSKISGGENFSVAIKTNGTLWTWGSDANGQMGNGITNLAHTIPTQVGTATNWAQIDAGRYHVIALNSGGGVITWGSNQYGQIGNGGGFDVTAPFLISGTSGVLKIDANATGSLIILSDNSLWTTGLIQYLANYNFTRFQTANNWNNVSAGSNHFIASKTDGTLWAWGNNALQQCSSNTVSAFGGSPNQVAGSNYSQHLATNVYSSLALKTDGSLYAFGQNHVGQLASGNLDNSIVSLISCPTILSNEDFEIKNSVSLYPNPVKNTLNISLENNSEIQNVVIYDVTGKQVKLQEGNTTSIFVEDLKSGLYLLEVTIEGNKAVKKFIKQ